MAILFQPSLTRQFTDEAVLAGGAQMFIYRNESTVDADWFTDASGNTPGTNPLVADANGLFPEHVFLDPLEVYTIKLTDAVGNTIWEEDGITGSPITGNGVTTGGTFRFDDSDLSEEVAADVRGGVYVPPASDLTGASGAFVREFSGPVDLKWFGTFEDTSVNHEIIQDALNFVEYIGGSLQFPEFIIQGVYPIDIPTGITILGHGYTTSGYENILPESETNTDKFAAFIGHSHPALNASNTNGGKTVRFTYHNLNAIVEGFSVTCSVSTEASNYSTGDKVQIRSRAYTRGFGNSEIPHKAQTNEVVSSNSSTGVIVFKYPILFDADNGYICNYTTSQVEDNVYPGKGFIVGPIVGTVIKDIGLISRHGIPIARVSVLDCDLDIYVKGENLCYFNSVVLSRVKIRGLCGDRSVELANNSAGSFFEIYAYLDKSLGENDPGATVKIGESSFKNHVKIHFFGDFNAAEFCRVSSCSDNLLEFYNVSAPKLTNRLLLIVNTEKDGSVDAGETQDLTDNNIVKFHGVTKLGNSFSRFVDFVDFDENLRENEVYFEKAVGVPTNEAIVFGGYQNKISGWVQEGIVKTTLGRENTIDLSGESLNYSELNYSTLSSLKINGILGHAKGKSITTSNTSYQLLFAEGLTQTITFSGASFELGTPQGTAKGLSAKITLVNNSGGTVTPTVASSNIWLNATFPAIADGQQVSFDVLRLPSTASLPKMFITNLSPAV